MQTKLAQVQAAMRAGDWSRVSPSAIANALQTDRAGIHGIASHEGRSVGSRKRVVRSLCNVAKGWVGSCVITITRLRELAGKSRPMLRPGRTYAKADALLTVDLRLRDQPDLR